MRAVAIIFRAGARARWRTWIALGLLLALAGGTVIALAAGARRTDSAYSRFVVAERAADVTIYLAGSGRQSPALFEHLPEVAASAETVALAPSGTDFTPVVLSDPRWGRTLNRFKFLSGKMPTRANETAVGFELAASRHLHVGSLLAVTLPSGITAASDWSAPVRHSGSATSPARGQVSLRVVGIEAEPGEFPPLEYSNQQVAYVAPAFLRSQVGQSWASAAGSAAALAVRLHHGGREVAPFLRDVERIAGAPVGTTTLSDQAAQVQSSMHLQAWALWLMAAFAGLTAALVLTQILLREVNQDATDLAVLRALGMTSREMALVSMLRLSLVAMVGAGGAVAIAFALSPVFPLGTAGIAEPAPGPSFDAKALCIGVALMLVALLLVVGLTARRASRRAATGTSETEHDHNAESRHMVRLASLPLVMAIGARMALSSGRGRSAVPVRAAIAATAIAVGAMTAAITFGASLGHLLATPGLYGTTYDADVELNANFGDARTLLPAMRSDHAIAAVSLAESGIPLRSRRTSFGALAVTPIVGSIEPTIVQGRLPRATGEIALGARTMTDLHTKIGQAIPVSVQGLSGPMTMRVVGEAVLAPLSDTQSLGRGAVVSPASLKVFATTIPAELKGGFEVPPPGDAFVRFAPGTSRPAAIDTLEQRLGGPSKVLVSPTTEPTDVFNFGQVRDLPQILAALLGGFAALTLYYLLVSAIRRRRHDLALLKTLGFVPRQISATIAWQATTTVVVALAIGVPVGIAAGRWVWSAVANGIGVIAEPIVPWAVVAALAAAALLLANVVAAWPALRAGRIAPAAILRSE